MGKMCVDLLYYSISMNKVTFSPLLLNNKATHAEGALKLYL